MVNNLTIPNIRLFVFGTLRVSGKFDFYMEGSKPLGLFYTEGQLMESAIGSAYVNFDTPNVATIGELHLVNFYCLQRINHLENTWGEFPKGYFLDYSNVWECAGENKNFDVNNSKIALCYKRKEETKVLSGDWMKRKNLLDDLGEFLRSETNRELSEQEIVEFVRREGKYY